MVLENVKKIWLYVIYRIYRIPIFLFNLKTEKDFFCTMNDFKNHQVFYFGLLTKTIYKKNLI